MTRLLNKPIRRADDERGFTIIEVMVAILVLLIGVLGTVKLIDGANAATVLTRDRVAGLSLARDVLEAARNVDYDQLQCANGQSACSQGDLMIGALQGRPGLASLSPASWTVRRSGITYTVGPVKSCKVDETRDGLGSADPSDPAFCGTYTCPTAGVTNCGDNNPDDYRKVDVTVTWTPGSGITGKKAVRQTALIANPSGGLGPPIKLGPCVINPAATSATAACPATPITLITDTGRPICDGTHSTPSNAAACVSPPPTCSAAPCVPLWVTTSPADTVHWAADDGKSNGNATALSGTTRWGINWPIGTLNVGAISPFTTPPVVCSSTQPAPIFTLAAATNVVLDGNYLLTVQGFDSLGIPGALKAVSVTLNRFPPSIPCPVLGGYDKPGAATGNSPVVDFDWTPNVERDIKGYKVYWAGPDHLPGGGDDVAVCGASSPVQALSCQDTSPSSHGLSNLLNSTTYYMTAVDQFDSESPASLPLVVTIALNTAPKVPVSTGGGAPVYGVTDGQPTLTWSIAPGDYSGALDADPLDQVIKYRIYRDGTAYANRIGAVPMPTGVTTTASFADTNAPVGSHTYYVTAVDNHYQESAPAGPVP
jgi:prepilin-type N-terminal cleavage/methylation domain-containing protein